VRGFSFVHATVAKGTKVDKRNGLLGGLSGLRVIFSLGTKKDPRGIAPRVLKQTNDSLKVLSYGGESVSLQDQALRIRAGKQLRVREQRQLISRYYQ